MVVAVVAEEVPKLQRLLLLVRGLVVVVVVV